MDNQEVTPLTFIRRARRPDDQPLGEIEPPAAKIEAARALAPTTRLAPDLEAKTIERLLTVIDRPGEARAPDEVRRGEVLQFRPSVPLKTEGLPPTPRPTNFEETTTLRPRPPATGSTSLEFVIMVGGTAALMLAVTVILHVLPNYLGERRPALPAPHRIWSLTPTQSALPVLRGRADETPVVAEQGRPRSISRSMAPSPAPDPVMRSALVQPSSPSAALVSSSQMRPPISPRATVLPSSTPPPAPITRDVRQTQFSELQPTSARPGIGAGQAAASGGADAKLEARTPDIAAHNAPQIGAQGMKLSGSPSGLRAQIGAYASIGLAQTGWAMVKSKMGGDTAGHAMQIEPVSVGGKTLYRALTPPFSTVSAARAFCDRMASAQLACLLRSEGGEQSGLRQHLLQKRVVRPFAGKASPDGSSAILPRSNRLAPLTLG